MTDEQLNEILTHLRLSRVDAMKRIDRGAMPDYNAGWRDALDMVICMLMSCENQNL